MVDGYTCCLPVLLPRESNDNNSIRCAVNTGDQIYVADSSSVGFGYSANLPYIIYGVVGPNGQFYDHIDANIQNEINELHLCKTGDTVGVAGTLVDYSTNFQGIYPSAYTGPYLNFQLMVGMYFTFKNTNNEIIKIDQPRIASGLPEFSFNVECPKARRRK